MAADGGGGGRGLSSPEGAGRWDLDHAPVGVWATQTGLGVLCFLF